MERIVDFLKAAGIFYVATVDKDQPRVRPFGIVHRFEGRIYLLTGKIKNVSEQIHANPKVEVCAFKDGDWLRLSGTLVEDDRDIARQAVIDAYPSLLGMYAADDGNTEVFYFRDATAVFSSFTKAPETIQF